MDRRIWVYLVTIVVLFVGGTVYLLQREPGPDRWKEYSYQNLSSEHFTLQHNERRLKEKEELLALLQSTIPFLPKEKADPLRKFLKEEAGAHVSQVETHNMFVQKYNERVKDLGFDTEEGVAALKEKPLRLLDEFQSALVPN